MAVWINPGRGVIVVDLGCHGHGMYDSIGGLIERFSPELLFGFDPLCEDAVYRHGATTVVTRSLAAWITDGSVPFKVAGTGSAIAKSIKSVPCFDLATWIVTLPEPIVLKMDVEGAEVMLARKLHETGMDERIALLLVELHGGELPELRCPVEEWWM